MYCRSRPHQARIIRFGRSGLFFVQVAHAPFELFFQQLFLIQVRVVARAREQFVVRTALAMAQPIKTTIWSASRTVEVRCEIRIVVRPSMIPRSPVRMRSSVCVSTAESESSRIRIRGVADDRRAQSRPAAFVRQRELCRARRPWSRKPCRSPGRRRAGWQFLLLRGRRCSSYSGRPKAMLPPTVSPNK